MVVDARRFGRALAEARALRSWPEPEVDLRYVGEGKVVTGAVRFATPLGGLDPIVVSESLLDVARAIDASDAQGTSSTLPVVRRPSSARWASAVSSSG
jgi:hypothetical protein